MRECKNHCAKSQNFLRGLHASLKTAPVAAKHLNSVQREACVRGTGGLFRTSCQLGSFNAAHICRSEVRLSHQRFFEYHQRTSSFKNEIHSSLLKLMVVTFIECSEGRTTLSELTCDTTKSHWMELCGTPGDSCTKTDARTKTRGTRLSSCALRCTEGDSTVEMRGASKSAFRCVKKFISKCFQLTVCEFFLFKAETELD